MFRLFPRVLNAVVKLFVRIKFKTKSAVKSISESNSQHLIIEF